MSLLRYPEYKDSGVEWLGEVPGHWEIKRLKHCLSLLTEKTESCQNKVALENIESWSGQYLPSDSEFEGDGVAFDKNDLLFGKLRPYLAKAYLAESAGEAVGDFHVMRPKPNVTPRFAQYRILNREFIALVDGSTFGSKMPRASWEFVSNMPFPLPGRVEQTAIATFLDRETAKIDGLIAEQEKLIALLAEKRQATISHAVTKGLNPDAPMKDSGVAWHEKVPAHWATPSLYMRYSSELGKMLDSACITGEHLIPYLRNVDVQWGRVNFGDLPTMDIEASEQDRYTVQNGDLLVCEGGEVGRAAIVVDAPEVLGYQKALHRLRSLASDEDSSFMYYTLLWAAKHGVFSASGQATIAHLTGERLRKYRFPKPPIKEQTAIVAFLDSEVARLNELTAAATHGIALLKERRSALISAAVTGKIDVRQS